MNERKIRAGIRRDLPKKIFERQPLRALWFIPLLAMQVAATWAVISLDLAWYQKLVLSVILAEGYAGMGFLAHEVLHDASVRSEKLQNFLGYIGLGPLLVSPHLWRMWHNRLHHGWTNSGDSDPDSFGTLKRYERAPYTRFVTHLAPGSGHWYSYLFLFYWFTFHGQVVLWIQTRYMRGFRGFDARRAKFDSLVLAGVLLAAAWLAGPERALFAIAIPLALANFVVTSYIATNHFLRPQWPSNNPVENSMSVRVPDWIDRLHFRFSHHVEHHLFPTMCTKFTPQLRAWLQEHVGERYICPPYGRAVAFLYKTPRVYRDPNTLCNPGDKASERDIGAITRELVGDTTR
ncbi:MAG: fatty acid desaturase [Acidimicrobiia bacterium]